MKKYRLEIILFVINMVYMILELAASRILSPYFGSTNIVWTSVIGIILLGSSIGNFIGGILADKKITNNFLKNILIILGIFILLIPLAQKFILESISIKIESTEVAAVISTIVLFLIPTLLFGLFSPIILTLKTKSKEKIGSISGRIYAISTIGSLFGTFIGGFILLPNFGSNQLLFILSIIIFLLILFVEELKIKNLIIIVIFIAISSGLLFYYNSIHKLQEISVLNGDIDASVSYDTEYTNVTIKNVVVHGLNRQMLFGTAIESVSYIEPQDYNKIVSSYIYYYNTMFTSTKEINDVLMIGGGGYAYPKYYISTYKDKKMDVVEIDEDVTVLAEKYFFLDKLFEENDPYRERLNIIAEDGRVYLNKNNKKYDAILNDAFTGMKPVTTLTTIEAVEKIYNSLNKDGLYLTNVIGSIKGEYSDFLYAEVNTIKYIFKNVYVIPCTTERDLELLQNFMVIATDQNLTLNKFLELDIPSDTITLTDNYAPIELLAKYANKKYI